MWIFTPQGAVNTMQCIAFWSENNKIVFQYAGDLTRKIVFGSYENAEKANTEIQMHLALHKTNALWVEENGDSLILCPADEKTDKTAASKAMEDLAKITLSNSKNVC